MSEIRIAPVAGRADLDQFIGLPYQLHAQDRCWAPPLRRDAQILVDAVKNPFYEHAVRELFLARRDGVVVGRIAAIDDRLHREVHGESTGFFGFFECVDDVAVARALLAAAGDWLKARGLGAVRGPVNPSLNDEAGMLVEGFDTPAVIMMTHNPRHYPGLVEAAGFRKSKDLLAFQNTHTSLPERLVAATDVVLKRYGVSCRRLDMRRFEAEVGLVKRLYNLAWQKNWGNVPLTDHEINLLAKQLRPIVIPELVVFAERAGEPIGFAAAVPDLNVALRANPSGRFFPGILKVLWAARRITRLRVLLLGVLGDWHGKGVDALLYRQIWEQGWKKGFRWAEAGWILEDNLPMINGLERLGFERYKRYRIYERPL
jgi:GNAT superfamily N-acetyltransferase